MNDKLDPFENSSLTTILVVKNMAQSKTFYLDILGAELFREYDGSVVLSFLNNWILLVNKGQPTEDKPNTHFLPPSNKNEVSHAFTMRVNNCQSSYEILKNRGAQFITPPHNWGQETRCFFQDPDGHLFEISEYRAT